MTAGRRGELLLAVESSCDETAVAVVRGGREVVCSVISSQVDLHAVYGGVVPELAARAHLELVVPLVRHALAAAGLGIDGRSRSEDVVAVGATVGPGLIGPLLVGVSAAKSLAMAWDVPFVGVNHLEGHLYASLLEYPNLAYPSIVLLVSGGHTLLIEVDEPGRYRIIGRTVDDAAGEAFDKVARYLGYGYPGGPAIELAGRSVVDNELAFTPPMLRDGLDFSFSGLKSAVVRYVDAHPSVASAEIAEAFERAVVDVLVAKTALAVGRAGARSVCLAGGVAANGRLRRDMAAACGRLGVALYAPSRAMCTDNAAMVGAAAHFRLAANGPSSLGLAPDPALPFPAS